MSWFDLNVPQISRYTLQSGDSVKPGPQISLFGLCVQAKKIKPAVKINICVADNIIRLLLNSLCVEVNNFFNFRVWRDF